MENISLFIVDIFIVFAIVLSFVIGWFRGATKEILSLLSWIGGIYLTVSIFPSVKSFARSYVNHGLIADFITICGLFVLFLTMLSVVNYVCSNFVKKSVLNVADKALGGAFGIFRGVVILAVLDFFATQYFFSETPELIKNSRIRPSIVDVSNFIALLLPDYIQEKIVSHLSQAKKQNLIDFLKDDIFENIAGDNAEGTNGRETVLAENIEEKELNFDNKPPATKNKNQTAEELSTLKPKRAETNKETRKSKTQDKKERQDMDRLLDQYG